MRSVFKCIDGHTCGNPVRLVIEGGPELKGKTMAEKRMHFIEEYDWIRKGLMFEPRGHDMMSGSFLFPPADPQNDVGIVFIETSGCLPMCGHGTIGAITFALEENIIQPKKKGTVRLETPAGLVIVNYTIKNKKVLAVDLTNIKSYLHSIGVEVNCPDLGKLKVDVAYGGNFYAIVDIQENFKGIDNYSADQLISWSRAIRDEMNQIGIYQHPEDVNINGLSHLLWAGDVRDQSSTARNAVFYGDKAIDRSPCGTGTSARMAQWYAQGKLELGDQFIHESIIGSKFIGSLYEETVLLGKKAIIPKIKGWAKITGYNTIIIDDDDPYAHGFQVI